MSECDGSCLNSAAVHHMRVLTDEYLGINCAFIDDEMHLICILAQRAVLAGLASDGQWKTLEMMTEKAEQHRAEHEKALGFAIQKQGKAPTP